MDLSQHVTALFISLASSTDNFLVGVSVGMTRKPLSQKVLWGIALCNAAGCLVATSGGSLGAQHFMTNDPAVANGIACLAFLYLALKEYTEAKQDADSQQNKRRQVSLDLALPMTLNNLAGGVAAGVVGIAPMWNFIYALLMSVLTMWVGCRLGRVFSGQRQTSSSLLYGPLLIYLALAVQSFRDAWS